METTTNRGTFGNDRVQGYGRPMVRRGWADRTETKAATKTTELLAYVLTVVAVAVCRRSSTTSTCGAPCC